MHASIPDFTDADLQRVAQLVLQRYGKPVAVEQVDIEVSLGGEPDEIALCPAVYWTERGAHFVVFKIAELRYRARFFYGDADQYSTGRGEYVSVDEGVLDVLRVQSDHERQAAGATSGATAADLADTEYDGPATL